MHVIVLIKTFVQFFILQVVQDYTEDVLAVLTEKLAP